MAASGEAVQKALQAVAQSTGWTYSILWRLCPRQGALVWAEGHYNGAIRTRKTTVHHQPGGEGQEDPETTSTVAGAGGMEALRRSRQLKELYDSLAAVGEATDGGGGAGGGAQPQHQQVVVPPPRRPTAALAPEDLTETEWFYLMCASYCFPPAVGLPGEAFVRRVHVWLCGANKVDSKVFSRAILARSAGIQTVACIPVDDGVLEIGTTEKVEEDICLIQYARSIFLDQIGAPTMPTFSGHSTSTPTTHINHQPFPKKENCIADINVQKNSLYPEHNDEMEDDDDRIDLDTNTGNDSSQHLPHDTNVGNEQGMLNSGSSELMLIGTSARMRDGCSNQEDDQIPMLMVCQKANVAAQSEFGPCHDFLDDDLSGKYLQPKAAEDQAVLAENAHYVKTVMTILRFNACRQRQAASSNTKTNLALSKNSSFSRWRTRWNHKASNDLQSMSLIPEDGTPQRMLKSILLSDPGSSHRSYRGDAAVLSPEPRDDGGEGTSRSQRRPAPAPVQPSELLSASHVLKERRRREKLNDRFVMLRSLVPFVTKMDRASILGDTIEYVKQLRRRIQELESSRARLVDSSNPQTTAIAPPPPPEASPDTKRGRHHTGSGYYLAQAGTGTAAEASGSCWDTTTGSVGEPLSVAGDTEVQVSIIGSDALLQLRCPYREGLLLRVILALHQELRLEVTSVQASSAGDVLHAELRAKVKEVHDGRRISISEVKRAIHLIVSSD